MKYVEKTGRTVDDAITAALVELGLPSDRVDIEVISEGSKGVLGIFGMKEARIRATVKPGYGDDEDLLADLGSVEKTAVKPAEKAAPREEAPKAAPVKKEAPVKAEKTGKAEKTVKSEKPVKPEKTVKAEKPASRPEKSEAPKKENRPQAESVPTKLPENFVMDTLVEERLKAAKEARAKEAAARKAEAPAFPKERNESAEEAVPEEVQVPKEPIPFSEDALKAREAAEGFLRSVLGQMGIDAQISAEMEETDVLCLNISGEKMAMIIGKHGGTLDSLQYLTAVVANKVTEEHIKIKLDAENYREKRKETLEKLAFSIAKMVRRTNRPVALEPMNPYERRIIHSALQSFRGVETHSEGEEPKRKVIISPVRGNYRRR